MDPSAYRLRSRSVPPSDASRPLDHVQGVHTTSSIEGTTRTGGEEGLSGQYASSGLMLPGISTSMAGPDAGSASSGEKTLRSVTQSEASMDIGADISKTASEMESRDNLPLEIDLMVSSDAETQSAVSKHYSSGSAPHYHGSHAGSGAGATAADRLPVPS